MRKELGIKAAIHPEPALVLSTYDEKGVADAMLAAWAGVCDTNLLMISIALEHQSVANLRLHKAMCVSPATRRYVKECDYLGIVSAKEVEDKLSVVGLHPQKAPHVDAPYIEELPLTYECRLRSLDEDTGILLLEIVNVLADPSILDEKGRPDSRKFEPVAYDGFTHKYVALGEVVGDAFKDGLAWKK